MVVFSMQSIMTNLLPRCSGYCAVDQTRRQFCQRRWPRTPATPPIANRADRIFETLKKCGLNWGVSVLRRAVEKANHRHGPRRRTAECGQQFPPSDGDCHTPLPREVRKRKDITPLACCLNRAAPKGGWSARPLGAGRQIGDTRPGKAFVSQCALGTPCGDTYREKRNDITVSYHSACAAPVARNSAAIPAMKKRVIVVSGLSLAVFARRILCWQYEAISHTVAVTWLL